MRRKDFIRIIGIMLCFVMLGSSTRLVEASSTRLVEVSSQVNRETKPEYGNREVQHYTLKDTNSGALSGPSSEKHESDQKLPVLYIDTEDGQKVTSRDEYKSAVLTIDNSCGLKVENGTSGSREMSDTLIATSKATTTYDINIRGRGNASWLQFPQKGYLIKFEERLSLFGMTRSKKYCLLPCYLDESLIRNNVAMSMATVLTNFEYVPGNLPVEVYLNGEYIGVYALSEKIEEGIEKVNLFSEYSYEELQQMGETNTPFILECGPYSQGVDYYDEMTYVAGLDYLFMVGNERLMINYPEITEVYAPKTYEITAQMDPMGQAICNGQGYEQYLDLDEWVDWFIMIELTGNTDAAIHRSTFFYRRPGDKVQIGPVWDFDSAFGHDMNDAPNHDRWTSTETELVDWKQTWMVRLYRTDSFMLAVRARWDEVKDELLAQAKSAAVYYADLTADSRERHNAAQGRNASQAMVQDMLDYLDARYQWIDQSIHQDNFNRNPYSE